MHRLLPTDEARAFFRWAAGAYALVTGVVLLACLRVSDGRLVYVLDDPAIHLAIARNVAEHGTWGVVPGHFESASSSPVWTAVLAIGVLVLPAGEEALAFVLNVVAGFAVLGLVARHQTALHPSARHPLDVLATVVIAVVVLFLPAAAMVGMEHVLHLALLLVAVPLLLRPGPAATRGRAALPYALIVVATLTRLETAFVAAGVGAALVLDALPWGRAAPLPWRPVARRVVGLGLASGVPLLAYGLVNKAMGQDLLPSSVAAKSESINGADRFPEPREVMDRLTLDPLLTVLVGACIVLAILGWRARTRWATLGTAVAVTAALHVTLAQVGWYDRYQIYLIGLALVALAWAARDIPASLRASRPHLVPLLVLVLLLTTTTKVALTVEAPRGVADTYEQRYQAARFLDRYYDGEPVATGELGYISLFHEGPLTDFYGLGDHEVLVARREIRDAEARKAFWAELVQRRGVAVAAIYPTNLLGEVPDSWILVGTWLLPRDPFTAYDRSFQFWATRPEEVERLHAHLEDYAPELPDPVIYEPNELARYRAALEMDAGG
ncbi:hypothetical protein HC251_09560 [Iamia sp. SCSIO 61187]|uniref:hypothetical protein n=1 Tax=Iamia sp. SCSIO 61187 TaxID=2722752 RepID=UPI001C632023|nr:hypothetical protein [Iamia sp. SCSIO 61187]QYG92656.1 hypothetical protein HC251_09560 [Iamia sp. SCSIO 61187]